MLSRLLTSTLIVAATLVVAAPAWAQLVPAEQPVFVPRVAVVVSPARLYADPSLASDERGLRTLSLPDALRAARTWLDRDPRQHVRGDFDERLVAAARADRQRDLAFIAERSAALGIEHFRSFNLATAASELESAIEGYGRTLLTWTSPADVATAWQYLALTHLELARSDAARATEHEARAVAAFRQMIRLAPQRVIGSDAYPESVVAVYERAYAAHVLDRGQQLRMTDGEARLLAETLDVDEVVTVFALTDRAGTELVLQVWDRTAQRFVHDEALPIDPTNEAAAEALQASLSRLLACQDLVPPPDYTPPDVERGSAYLEAGYSSGTFLGTVTRRPFWMNGASVSLTYLLRDTIGVYAEGAQWVARRDRDGDLVGSLDVTRLSFGAASNARWPRGRVFVRGGLDVTRVGALRATTSFWCKVSEGEPVVFDELRECEEDDVVDSAARVQLGARFGAGGAVRLGGPLWLQGSAHITLYVAPFEDRSLDSPLGFDLGLGYRF